MAILSAVPSFFSAAFAEPCDWLAFWEVDLDLGLERGAIVTKVAGYVSCGIF